MVNLLDLQKLILYLYLNCNKETYIHNHISLPTFQPKIAITELIFTKILTKEKTHKHAKLCYDYQKKNRSAAHFNTYLWATDGWMNGKSIRYLILHPNFRKIYTVVATLACNTFSKREFNWKYLLVVIVFKHTHTHKS